jgi:hypothetical protein
MNDSPLADAFARAGIKPASERLREIARAALASRHPTLDGARAEVLRKVSADAALLWALFERWQRPAVDLLLSEVAASLRAEKADSLGAKGLTPTNMGSPPAGGIAASGPSAAEVEAARQTVARVLSKLDFFKVNGRPIGDCTAQEVFAWSDHHARDVRFARALAANLPPDRPIRQFVRPEEADALYERITQEMGHE